MNPFKPVPATIAILSLALSLATPAHAGWKKKLLGVAVVGAAAGAANQNSKAKQAALARAGVGDENNQKRLNEVWSNAQAVTPDGLDPKISAGVCGPAALFTALRGTPYLPEKTTFKQFVDLLYQGGSFSSFFDGMRASQVESALEELGIPAEVHRNAIGANAAAELVTAVDEGRVAFVFVRAAESFKTITGRQFPVRDQQHVIGVVAVQRNASGEPTDVALYDVNVYSGQPLQGLEKRKLSFVPYKSFVALLGSNAFATMPFIEPFPAYIVSKKRVVGFNVAAQSNSK